MLDHTRAKESLDEFVARVDAATVATPTVTMIVPVKSFFGVIVMSIWDSASEHESNVTTGVPASPYSA